MEQSDVNTPWLTEFFGNYIFLRKLETILSYADLKALRLASPRLNEIVLQDSNFVSRTTFNLTEKAIHDRVLANIGFGVQQVAVSLFFADCQEGHNERDEITQEEIEHVYEKLKGVQKLTIQDNVLVNKDSTTLDVFPDVERLIQSSSCLKKLNLDWEILVPQYNLLGEEVFTCLEKLKEIEIMSPGSDMVLRFGRNRSVSDLTTYNFCNMDRLAPEAFQRWLWNDLLKRCRNTMERIVVLEYDSWTYDEDFLDRTSMISPSFLKFYGHPHYHFPKLKEVGFRFFARDAPKVLNFLRRHSCQLTSIDVRILGALPQPFMDLFEELAPQLKVLRIELLEFANPVNNQFAFLRNCNRLEDFSLNFVYHRYAEPNGDTFPALLANIPPGVRKLRLGGVPNPTGATITLERIHHLSKLESLVLHQCDRECDNNALKVIFGNLTFLQELKLTGLSQCTDEGFSGLKHGGHRIISALNNNYNYLGMKKLTIEGQGMTERGLLNAFKFPNLEYLAINVDMHPDDDNPRYWGRR